MPGMQLDHSPCDAPGMVPYISPCLFLSRFDGDHADGCHVIDSHTAWLPYPRIASGVPAAKTPINQWVARNFAVSARVFV